MDRFIEKEIDIAIYIYIYIYIYILTPVSPPRASSPQALASLAALPVDFPSVNLLDIAIVIDIDIYIDR